MCCGGDGDNQIKYEDIMPEELQNLRRGMANILQNKIGTNATPLPEGFPLYAPPPSTAYNAMDLINRMMGYGHYQGSGAPGGGSYPFGASPGAGSVDPWRPPNDPSVDEGGVDQSTPGGSGVGQGEGTGNWDDWANMQPYNPYKKYYGGPKLK